MLSSLRRAKSAPTPFFAVWHMLLLLDHCFQFCNCPVGICGVLERWMPFAERVNFGFISRNIWTLHLCYCVSNRLTRLARTLTLWQTHTHVQRHTRAQTRTSTWKYIIYDDTLDSEIKWFRKIIFVMLLSHFPDFTFLRSVKLLGWRTRQLATALCGRINHGLPYFTGITHLQKVDPNTRI